MTDLLGIGASAVNAYGSALGVIGENVANAQTEGYARRDVSIQSNGPITGSGLYTNTFSFGGSQASGVTRAWDQFKANDALAATADDGRASATSTWLNSASNAIDDSDTGIGAQVTAVFTAASTFAADPSSPTARSQMLNAIGTAASSISGAAAQLAKTSSGIANAATGDVGQVNDDLSQLAKLNTVIARTADNSDAKATLADQRDKLLGDLSGKIGIDAKVATDGTVAVSLTGSTGVSLLSGSTAALVAMNQSSDGRLSFTAGLGSNVQSIAPTGGSLAGFAGAANTVTGLRSGLDTIASNFANQINNWNAQGVTPAGTAGTALLATTGGAAGLALTATSPDAIAAAGSDGSANGNLLSLSDQRGPGGVEAQVASLVSTGAQALASAKSQASAAATRKSAALTAQADVNGISLDQEAADLVRYQQAYQGSAKIIQAAQTTMNAILSLFGG